MEGYQFAHVEVYATKPSGASAKGEAGTKRKNGQRVWSVAEILDENERMTLASEHVIEGRPAPEIMPGAYSTFQEFREAHARAAAVKESFKYTKNGKTSTRRRKLRSDAATMYTSIVSLPVLAADALEDPDLRKQCMDVLGQALEFERTRMEKCGGQLGMGVIHWDEKHVHMHILGLDPKRGRVDHLHPGRAAKKARTEELQGSGEPKKEINKSGDRAYCDAMRGYQADIHEAVFSKAGLLRFGPRRERLSTRDYKRRKAAARENADLAQRHADLSGAIGDIQLDMVMATHARKQSEHEAIVLEQDKSSVARKRADLDTQYSDLATREAQLLREKKAMVRGRHAIEREEFVYRPQDDEKPERLTTGPNAPKDPHARKHLTEVVRPAARWLLGLARSLWRAKKRERDAERERAEARRAATILAEERKGAGLSISAAITDIASGAAPASYTVASFPEALAVSEDEDLGKLQERLDAMTNATIVRRYDATVDAALLSEDETDIAAQFEKGQRILSLTARQRGLDLLTGKHDPAAATDPTRARLHVDTPARPIRVHHRQRDRQRVR